MLAWSVRRRVIYLLLALAALLAAASGLFFWFKPAPTCFDGKQNSAELGVDCGGGCARVCRSETAELQVIWSKVLPVSDGRYDTASLVINPNRDYAVEEASYRVKILDENNLLITTVSGRLFLGPGERLVVYGPHLLVGQRRPVRAALEFTAAPVWRRITAATQPPRLEVAKKNFVSEPDPARGVGGARLTATVVNESLADLANIAVVAVLSDENQNALAVSSTLVEDLPAGASRELAFTWPQALAPAFFDFYPHFAWWRTP